MLKLCQFTAWCTYTDGHVIGVDASLTQKYLIIIKHFSAQCSAERKSLGHGIRNRLVLEVSDEQLMVTLDQCSARGLGCYHRSSEFGSTLCFFHPV